MLVPQIGDASGMDLNACSQMGSDICITFTPMVRFSLLHAPSPPIVKATFFTPCLYVNGPYALAFWQFLLTIIPFLAIFGCFLILLNLTINIFLFLKKKKP